MTALRLGARLWWGAVPLALLLWGTGALLVPALPGLPSPSLLPAAAVPVLWFARDVTLALAVGSVAVAVLVDSASPRRWALGWGAAGLGLVLLGLPAIRADIDAGSGGASVLDLVRESNAGRALVAQAVVLAFGLAVLLLRRRAAVIAALAALAVGIAIPPLGGHAGLSGPHAAAGIAIGVHMASASIWAGGLAATCLLLVRDHEVAPRLLPRFSVLALVCVVVTAEAGLLSASLITDSPLDLLGTTYGSIILAKAALLAWLVWLGWQQRRRAIDRLPDASVAATVVAIAAIELVVLGVVMGAAVVLTRIGPSPLPGAGFAPLTLVVLAVAVPMLVVSIHPGGWAVTDSLPEAAAVLLMIVIVEVGGVGLLGRLLGPVGVLLEVALLLAAGWLALSAARQRIGGLLVLAIGLPVALPVAAVLSDQPGIGRMPIVAVLAAEALLAAMWLQRRRRTAVDEPVVTVAG